MATLLNHLKRFDVYRDVSDLPASTSGGIVSVLAGLLIAYLFFAELFAFMTPEITQEMFVDAPMDHEGQHAMLQINMNISMPQIPCAILSVDAQDIMGSHVVDVGGKLHKMRLDRTLRPRLGADGQPLPTEGGNPEDQLGEGCNVWGNMIVKRVPGNFHVSAHAHAHMLASFFKDKQMNVSHIIHDLSFGDVEEFRTLENAVVSPLKGTARNAALDNAQAGEAKSYEYFINIVPAQYVKTNGKKYSSYQYVANSNEVLGRYRVPAVYFRYEISAVTVKFTQRSKALAHFLVQVCAIIGGVFTVLGLINGFVNSGVKRVMEKAQLRKLG